MIWLPQKVCCVLFCVKELSISVVALVLFAGTTSIRSIGMSSDFSFSKFVVLVIEVIVFYWGQFLCCLW